MTNGSQSITDIVANSSDHEDTTSEATQDPTMPFGEEPLPSLSCYEYSKGDATRLPTISRETKQVLQTRNEGGLLLGVPCRHTSSLIHEMISNNSSTSFCKGTCFTIPCATGSKHEGQENGQEVVSMQFLPHRFCAATRPHKAQKRQARAQETV